MSRKTLVSYAISNSPAEGGDTLTEGAVLVVLLSLIKLG